MSFVNNSGHLSKTHEVFRAIKFRHFVNSLRNNVTLINLNVFSSSLNDSIYCYLIQSNHFLKHVINFLSLMVSLYGQFVFIENVSDSLSLIK